METDVAFLSDYRHEHGPFDLIGDVHGCGDELEELLRLLGYEPDGRPFGSGLSDAPLYTHPQGRRLILLGDLVDRGPRILDTLRLTYRLVEARRGFAVLGNHDHKLLRLLDGHQPQLKHGLENSVAELKALPEGQRETLEREFLAFLRGLPFHMILDEGRLVAAHAGMSEQLQGQVGKHVKSFALFGPTTGQQDEYGLPVRIKWAEKYRGKALMVYGHTPVPEPEWLNNTVNIDTGCVFGGRLTALRYPERETVQVQARRIYYPSSKPFPTPLKAG